ncbi:MAG: hypothetical protein AAF662_10900 [Pseudomonadota bacterium]
MPAHSSAFGMLVEVIDNGLNPVAWGFSVVVGEADVVALSSPQPRIKCVDNAGLIHVNNLKAMVALGESGRASSGFFVVHPRYDQYFDVRVGLVRKRVETPCQILRTLVRRHNNTN